MGEEVKETPEQGAINYWKTIYNQISSLAQALGLENQEILSLLILWEIRALHDHLDEITKLLGEEHGGYKEPAK